MKNQQTDDIKEILDYCIDKIQSEPPLIHNITNFVVMNSTANILLAIGASPIMAHSLEEVREIANVAGAVVLNIGTLDSSWLSSMLEAGKTANKKNIPVVLDPVGSGATTFRTKAVKQILSEIKVDILRGNLSEIMSLVSSKFKTKGVDSTILLTNEKEDAIKNLAIETNCIIVASGKTDFVTDGKTSYKIDNGHPVMTKITGTGCGLSAVTGAFCAVRKNELLNASVAASAFYAACGQKAAEVSVKPGSFFTEFLDILYSFNKADLKNIFQIEKLPGNG